jgi:hypothetical protein
MTIKDMFEVGEIMEWEDKATSIKVLDGDDCVIVGKVLNKKKTILQMKRASDDSEGKVFVRLKDEFEDQFAVSKKLLASKKVIGMSLNEFKNLDVEEL